MFRKFISDTMAIQKKLDALRAKYPAGERPTVADGIDLARCYRELGMNEMAVQTIRLLAGAAMTAGDAFDLASQAHSAGDSRLAAQFMDKIAGMAYVRQSPERLQLAYRIYGGVGDYAKMGEHLELYLARRPKDWQAWLDSATLAMANGQAEKAERAIMTALAVNREAAAAYIERNPELLKFAEQAISRRRQGTFSPPGF
jgi:Flp pilus assembly protein TadD